MKPKRPVEMTDAEFERWMKRKGIRGMAAAVAATNRRRAMAKTKTSP